MPDEKKSIPKSFQLTKTESDKVTDIMKFHGILDFSYIMVQLIEQEWNEIQKVKL